MKDSTTSDVLVERRARGATASTNEIRTRSVSLPSSGRGLAARVVGYAPKEFHARVAS